MEVIDNSNVWDDEVKPEVETQVVEQISEQVEVQAEVVADVQEDIVETEGTELVVKKIIEKYPEFESEDAKSLFEAFQKGDEDSIYNFLTEKRKDYNTMSDHDIVKEGLVRANPKWTEKDIELELKSKYGSIAKKKDLSEIDQDIYPDEFQSALSTMNE